MAAYNAPPSRTYKLLGGELSLFTGKIRAYLNWKGIPFQEVLSGDTVYRTIILPLTSVAFIPVLLVCDGSEEENSQQREAPNPLLAIQDTKAIMDYLEQQDKQGLIATNGSMSRLGPLFTSNHKLTFASMLMELLADEWLVVQAMYWRWGKGNFEQQRKFIEYEFGSSAMGGKGGYSAIMKLAQKRMIRFATALPGLGVSEETSPAIRSQFHTLLGLMSTHLEHYPFLLGSRITLADFAFYGSFYAHLGRDPVPESIIKTEAPLVFEWIERVGGRARWNGLNVEKWDAVQGKWMETYGETRLPLSAADKKHQHLADVPQRGGSTKRRWQQQDSIHLQVPSSATSIAQLLFRDYSPILLDTLKRTLAYLEERSSSSSPAQGVSSATLHLPRTIGKHNFRMHAYRSSSSSLDSSSSLSSEAEEVQGSRAVYTHAVWIFDRLLQRAYSSSRNSGEERAEADAWMRAVAGEDSKNDGGQGELFKIWKDCVQIWEAGGWRIERDGKNKLVAVKEKKKRDAIKEKANI